jgi:hypothetical protein
VRWTYTVPDRVNQGGIVYGVDRAGNSLILWDGTARFGTGAEAGQWIDANGQAGAIFLFANGIKQGDLLPNSANVMPSMNERMGSGLLIAKSDNTWLGQIDSLATHLNPPPAWLAARPDTLLHMIHGGKGYAVSRLDAAGPACEQQIEVISPSGKSCGKSTFAVDSATCKPGNFLVGFDGTVVQQLPVDLPACTAAGHQCTCSWHAWPGFFR